MGDYPKPLIIEPLQLPHKQTFILLHGRGSTADKFGPAVLESGVAPPPSPSSSSPSSTPPGSANNTTASAHLPATPQSLNSSATTTTSPLTLATAFPHARFVFPTAARRRATIYKRAYTHQWFNNWKLDPPATDREDLQADGLRETAAYLHGLLRTEIALVPGGAASIVLGGLSQGCAASLVALLLWEGERLAAAVGMCGWLPFAERLIQQAAAVRGETGGTANTEDDDDGFDPFARDDGDGPDGDSGFGPAAAAVGWLRDELELAGGASSEEAMGFQDTPIFLGHGTEDDRVSIVLGRRATECLTAMSGEVSWNEYEGLGHWYSGPMLRDLVDFIREQTGWEDEI